MWLDEAIEFFICPDKSNPKLFYQFISNASGSKYDGRGRRGSRWNGVWDVKAKKEKDHWSVEIAIPWETLGISAPTIGSTLPFNAARDRYIGGGQFSSPAFERNAFARINSFDEIHFLKSPLGLGSESAINDFFIKTITKDCKRTAREVSKQIENVLFLFGEDERIRNLEKKFTHWKNMGTGNLKECVQSYGQMAVVLGDVQSALSSIKTDYSLKVSKNGSKDEIILGRENRFIISRKNGVLLGIIRENGKVLSPSTSDKYRFETRDKEKISLDEWSDMVVEGNLEICKDEVEGLFKNSALPSVLIKKTYHLVLAKVLSKRGEFRQIK